MTKFWVALNEKAQRGKKSRAIVAKAKKKSKSIWPGRVRPPVCKTKRAAGGGGCKFCEAVARAGQ